MQVDKLRKDGGRTGPTYPCSSGPDGISRGCPRTDLEFLEGTGHGGNSCIGTWQPSTSAISNAWQPFPSNDVFDTNDYHAELVPAQSFHVRPRTRKLEPFAQSICSPEGLCEDDSIGLYSNLHDEIPSAQEYGLEGTSYNNHGIPVVPNTPQAWEFNNGLPDIGLSSTTPTNQSFANTEDLNYLAPFPEHNGNMGTLDSSVADTHSLDMLSLDAGHAAYERLMSELDGFQVSEFGLGNPLPDPSHSADLSLNPDSFFQPGHGTLDLVRRQRHLFHQMPGQGFQDQPTVTSLAFACAFGNCHHSFRRKSDLTRHRKTVHGVNHVKYFCHIPGCPKSRGHGQGYSRDDKLTEHLWKKDGSLGFTKSR
ncbi:hypothetical protein N431DRAFT_540013 [Stipitochalara longipes BDJ]|nr:hypothetical protein N431DRAFT_540013 [Stipitochalara longipes BDJ]